jgi:hypothetical protein
MRRFACFPPGLLGVLLVGSHCGGVTPDLPDGSSDAGPSGGSSSGVGSSSNGGSSGSGASSSSGGSGGRSSSSSGGTSSSSGGSSGVSSSGTAGSSSGAGSGGVDGGRVCLSSNCDAGTVCCGFSCCASDQLCCPIGGPVPTIDRYYCLTPTASQPNCPPTCAPRCVSDRNVKRDIEPVDERVVLDRVSRMPLSTWSYQTEDPRVRHLGPMAQDFYAAFGLGDSDRTYDAIDAHGVAFAAIKALSEQVQEQNARIERLERENGDLRRRAAPLTCAP